VAGSLVVACGVGVVVVSGVLEHAASKHRRSDIARTLFGP